MSQIQDSGEFFKNRIGSDYEHMLYNAFILLPSQMLSTRPPRIGWREQFQTHPGRIDGTWSSEDEDVIQGRAECTAQERSDHGNLFVFYQLL